nr:hypothetical protein [Tanacetum cinerariifolium]
MSLEDSDDLNIPDAALVDPVLKAGALSKFDRHLYRSSLNESHVRYLVKLYGIPEELHPRVVPEGMTMDALPHGAIDAHTSLKKWKDKFFLVDRRAAPIAMAWRHHDSSVADPFGEYNASNVAKLREVVISLRWPPLSILYVAGLSNVWKHADRAFSIKDLEGKVITMAEFLRLPNFKGGKIAVGTLLPPGAARVTHLAPPAARLEDIPPKTGDMIVAEIPCMKVVDDKEKKKMKVEEKAATKAPVVNVQAEAAVDKPVGREGPRKKRWIRARAQEPPDSEHVSSPTPLNQAKPLEALANEDHASLLLSVGRTDTLRDQTDEHAISPQMRRLVSFSAFFAFLFLSPVAYSFSFPLCYSAERFENLPFTPQWGLTDSSRMDNSRECRDIMANLFTPADEEFFNNGVRDESAIRRSWKLLCQSAQQQANILLRFEALKEQHADLAYVHESCTDVKARYKECQRELAMIDRIRQLEEALKQAEADAEQLRAEKVHFAVKAGKREIVRQKIMNQYLPTFVHRLHQSAGYNRSLGQVFTLAVGKGFIDGISIGRKEEDIQAILKATPNVDPTSSETFLTAYENFLIRDETRPTPGGGPRDTPMDMDIGHLYQTERFGGLLVTPNSLFIPCLSPYVSGQR